MGKRTFKRKSTGVSKKRKRSTKVAPTFRKKVKRVLMSCVEQKHLNTNTKGMWTTSSVTAEEKSITLAAGQMSQLMVYPSVGDNSYNRQGDKIEKVILTGYILLRFVDTPTGNGYSYWKCRVIIWSRKSGGTAAGGEDVGNFWELGTLDYFNMPVNRKVVNVIKEMRWFQKDQILLPNTQSQDVWMKKIHFRKTFPMVEFYPSTAVPVKPQNRIYYSFFCSSEGNTSLTDNLKFDNVFQVRYKDC